MPVPSPNGLSVNPGSISGPSLAQGTVSNAAGTATVTIRGGGSAPLAPSGSAGIQSTPVLQGSSNAPQLTSHPVSKGSSPPPPLTSTGTGARANPTITTGSGGTGPSFGSGKSAPLPSGVKPNVLDLGTRTGSSLASPSTVSSPPSSALTKSAPLAGVGAAGGKAAGAAGGISGAGAGGLAVGAAAAGLAIGEGIRRAGLAAEEAGIIPDTPIFEQYPPGWWDNLTPNSVPSPVPVTVAGDPPFSGGQSPGVTYDMWLFFPNAGTGEKPFLTKVRGAGPMGSPQVNLTEKDSDEFWAQVTVSTGSGVKVASLGGSTQRPVFKSAPEKWNPTIDFVERVDGQPDTGGDPPPQEETKPRAAPGSVPGHSPSPNLLTGGVPLSPPGASTFPGSGLSPAAGTAGTAGTTGAAGAAGAAGTAGAASSPSLQGGGSPSSSPGSSPGVTSATGSQSGLTTVQSPSSTPSTFREAAPLQPGGCSNGCGGALAGKLDAANSKLDNLCNPSRSNDSEGECTLDEVCEKLNKLIEGTGVNDFPLSHPLLTGDNDGVKKNLVELIEWSVKNIDATNGYWPLEVKVVGDDGNDKTVKIKDQSHAFHELFGAVFTIAEDADAAVNIGARLAIESVSSRIRTIQNGKMLKAIIKHLGFKTRNKKGTLKIGFTPKASGSDGLLQNQEMANFLKKSTQLFTFLEHSDGKTLETIMDRVLESTEIARAALWKPIKRNKRGETTAPGESLRREEKSLSIEDLLNEEWEAFIDDARKRGIEIDEKPKDRK